MELDLIKEAELAIDKGEVYSHEEVLEMSKIWLKK
jgi:predicted transcriptional regulator